MLPSTADQTLAHQRSQAEAVGFQIDEVIADRGYPASALGCANSLKGDTASYRPDLVYRYCRRCGDRRPSRDADRGTALGEITLTERSSAPLCRDRSQGLKALSQNIQVVPIVSVCLKITCWLW